LPKTLKDFPIRNYDQGCIIMINFSDTFGDGRKLSKFVKTSNDAKEYGCPTYRKEAMQL